MPNDLFVTLLLVAAILVLADLPAGGAMMMIGMSAVGMVASHPLGLLALILLTAGRLL